MPQSDRLYYSDPFLRTFSATVTGIRELAPTNGDPVWQLSLDTTAFYPTSGGQPFDTGLLHLTSQYERELDIAVEQVEEDEDGAVWHFVRRSIPPGTPVEGRINWERRLDHMQQHTGQHLLSAVFLRELGAATVSFHLGDSTSTIDLACAPPALENLERVERISNEFIAEDRPVTIRHVSRSEAAILLAGGELRKLPDRQGAIRLIEIADLDTNACGGTHVRATGQIGGLLIRGVEKVTRGVRIEFVCGQRAVRAARADGAILSETAALLSTGAPELAASVSRLLGEARAGAKERLKLREELAALQGAKLATEAEIDNGLRLLVRSWKDRDREFVKLLAARTAAAAPSTAVIFCAQDTSPFRVFVARGKDLGIDCGRILKEALAAIGLRGGGSPDLAQGDVPPDQEAALRASVIDAMRRALAEVREQS